MDTKITLQRKKFLMRHIKRMELHYFESKALDLIICKQYKLKQYVFFFPLFVLLDSIDLWVFSLF